VVREEEVVVVVVDVVSRADDGLRSRLEGG
jgi:hypothetical protein